MPHKILVLVLVLLVLAGASLVNGQSPGKGNDVATVKFTLKDFKNPNEFLQRAGLIRFLPESDLLAVSGHSADIIIYALNTGEIRSKIDGKGFNAFSFLPDGKTALARDLNSHLKVFDLASGNMVRELKGRVASADEWPQTIFGGPSGMEMRPVDLSPDKKKVLAMRGARTADLVDFETGETLHQFINPDKTRAGVMMFKAIYGFDLSFSVGLVTLNPDTNFTPDGRLALLSNMSRTTTLWDVESGKMAAQIGPLENTILNEAFSPDGNLLATTDSDGVTMIWSVPEGKLLATIGNKKDSNYIAAWSPDSRIIWTVAFKEDARAYDARTGKQTRSLAESKALGVWYSPDGKTILSKTLSDKNSIGSIWNAETGALIASIPKNKGDEIPYVISFDPTGSYVVSASKKDVKIWNTKGELVQLLERAVFPVRFSSDGKLLATGGKNDVGYVWQIDQH